MINQPIMTKIVNIVNEAKNIKTFTFDMKLNAKPGQFIMMWIPEIDEKPFSIYSCNNDLKLTISKIGRFTEKLFDMNIGNSVGIRGAFGKPFDIRSKHIAMVGGGYGSAPLTFLGKEALKLGIKSELIIGARNKELLLYRENDYPNPIKRHYCTDDGSFGFHGYTTEKLIELLKNDNSIDMVYTVGPELMMKKIIEICDEFNIDCQVSIERYMKCGYGICGSCCVDPTGHRMCVEGPCVDKEYAKKVTEFGKYHRIASGEKVFHK